MNREQLDTFLENEFEMEIFLDLTTVKEDLDSIDKALKTGELSKNTIDKEVITELEKYKDYSTFYCSDSVKGGMFGQGYAIVEVLTEDNYKFIDFIRTI